MKRVAQLLLPLILLLASCERGVYYASFTDEERSWMPYDTMHVADRFVNALNDTIPLELTERNFSHPLQSGNEKASYFDAAAVARFSLDTLALSIHLEKEALRHSDGGGNFSWHLNAAGTPADYDWSPYTHYDDSLQVGSQWYHGVYTTTIDTLSGFSGNCWQFRFSPGTGFLELNMRGGNYYRKI